MLAIEPIQSHHIEEVKKVIVTACCEIFQISEDILSQYNDMSDIDNARSHYLDNQGNFLVLLDCNKVVGSGGIRRLSDEICELKRMWFLKDYRGRGWGKKMTRILFDFAQNAGYKKMRLDLVNPQIQARAFEFYQRLGFYQIARYNDSICTIFMEKTL
jgi:putative acetyltransferase